MRSLTAAGRSRTDIVTSPSLPGSSAVSGSSRPSSAARHCGADGHSSKFNGRPVTRGAAKALAKKSIRVTNKRSRYGSVSGSLVHNRNHRATPEEKAWHHSAITTAISSSIRNYGFASAVTPISVLGDGHARFQGTGNPSSCTQVSTNAGTSTAYMRRNTTSSHVAPIALNCTVRRSRIAINCALISPVWIGLNESSDGTWPAM